jgi:hypothetical protein
LTASPAIAATASRSITSSTSSAPSAAKVPTAKSRESPGRNGVITSPVSQNTMRKSSP